MTVTFKNVRPLVGGKIRDLCNIVVKDGLIASVGGAVEGDVFDCGGKVCAAGFIDVHTHGGWGHDCMEATESCLATISAYHLYTGITSYCPTTMTASPEDIEKAVGQIRAYRAKSPYARIVGAHLEGPYLSQKAAGAHPPKLLISPLENDSFVAGNLDAVTRVTVAPNVAGADVFTAKYVSKGVQISLGHDNSIDDEIYACVDAGASSVTHMYNCTSRPSRRDNPKKHLGLTEVGLIDERLTDEVIADDRHVPDKLFGMIFRLKGASGICLVSDSLSVAGMPEGDYYIGAGDSKQSIRVEDGVAVLPAENTYAGSVTPVSKMAQRLISDGYAPEDALSMATLVPARLIGLTDRGDLKEGMLADFNLFEDDWSIAQTVLGGNPVDRAALVALRG